MDLNQFELYGIILGAVASAVTVFFGGFHIGRLYAARSQKTDVEKLRSLLGACKVKLERIREAFRRKEESVWFSEPIERPADLSKRFEHSIPIISIANLKGGVGKSTIAANLGAFFDRALYKRVLFVDLDYQGSLSSLCLIASGQTDFDADQTEKIVSGTKDGEWLRDSAIRLPNAFPRSALSGCFYDFANEENFLLFEWLTGDLGHDLRFNLARAVTSPQIAEKFDVVILDLPPRITTGFVNALAASTHLLIPSILDRISAEAVYTFLKRVKQFRRSFCPQLELLGVVPTMTTYGTTLTSSEQSAMQMIENNGPEGWGNAVHLFREEFIPDQAAIARAANAGLAYEVSSARPFFDRLGAAIDKRLGHNARAWVPGAKWKETAE